MTQQWCRCVSHSHHEGTTRDIGDDLWVPGSRETKTLAWHHNSLPCLALIGFGSKSVSPPQSPTPSLINHWSHHQRHHHCHHQTITVNHHRSPSHDHDQQCISPHFFTWYQENWWALAHTNITNVTSDQQHHIANVNLCFAIGQEVWKGHVLRKWPYLATNKRVVIRNWYMYYKSR